MAFIQARGPGKYLVGWRDVDGKQRWRTCPSLSAARELKLEVETARSLGKEWEPESAREVVDLETVTSAFVEHRALRLAPRTLHRYSENLDIFVRFLRERQPKGPISALLLSRPLLEDYYAWLCRAENGLHGRAREPDTARKIAEVVQLMWSWAEESERWPGQIPRPRKIEMVRSDPQPVVAPTWAEMDACIAAANGWHRQLVTFLRYTGLRVGETMLIEWRDVDLERGALSLRPEISKTGAGRVLPLSPHLLDEIAGWGVREGFLVPSGRLKGDRYRLVRARDIARAWERAGVRPEAWQGRPDHAFRRGYKSGLLSIGANPDAVDFLQGHALGRGGARARYIDPYAALPLRETVSMVPPIASGAAATNVVALTAPKKAAH